MKFRWSRRFLRRRGLLRFTQVGAVLIIAGWLSFSALAQEAAEPSGDASPAMSGPMFIPEPPLVSLQALPGYGPAPLLVGFMLNAADPAQRGIVSFTWNFGDGHVSTEPPLFAYNTYTKPGTYVVTVTVTTADGRSATGFTGVIVKPSNSSRSQQQPRAH